MNTSNAVVSVIPCDAYELDAVRQAIKACLEPLGGMQHFVHPGMRVLLKPNLLASAEREQAVTTHPMVVQVVAEMVQAAGGEVLVGDSPSGPVNTNQAVYQKAGMVEICEHAHAALIIFDDAVWKRQEELNYYIARPLTEVDLVINLPKIKTHGLTLYTGAVKNLFGAIPGKRKMEVHLRSPMLPDFSRELVTVLGLVHPGLNIMDGIIGQEGRGPGASGTPHAYKCLAASTDAVALDTVITQAMGYRPGEVLHLTLAGARGLGVSDPAHIKVDGQPGALNFGKLKLPAAMWYTNFPSWVSQPLRRMIRQTPQVDAAKCIGCGECAQVCPGEAITVASPAQFDLDRCIECLCCAEVCPQGAITPKFSRLAKMIGVGE
jgi:uncharacterized protein (DUF362 family)/Pyruvate/2-oxoacid:ferredoxin oxidoreductase delta subunit